MDMHSMSDKAISAELGARLKALRLRQNMTQKELATAVLLSINSIKSLESGSGKLSTLIAVLRELGALNEIDNFIPEITISPVQLAKTRGKKRQRASAQQRKENDK